MKRIFGAKLRLLRATLPFLVSSLLLSNISLLNLKQHSGKGTTTLNSSCFLSLSLIRAPKWTDGEPPAGKQQLQQQQVVVILLIIINYSRGEHQEGEEGEEEEGPANWPEIASCSYFNIDNALAGEQNH